MKKLYLLGHPVAHSKSPVMHNALYQELGLDWHYDLMDCPTEEQAREFLAKGDFIGINITTPYKPLAFEMAQLKAPSSQLALGANVFTFAGDQSICYNVDGEGAIHNLMLKGVDFTGKNIVICGSGPTSMAILHAAALSGVSQLSLLGRNAAHSDETLQGYLTTLKQFADDSSSLPEDAFKMGEYKDAFESTKFVATDYASASDIIKNADVIVDATPLGMNAGDPAAFDVDLLHEGQVVFDVVYAHGETALAAGAKKAGCEFYDGSGMLIAQAVTGAQAFMKSAGVTTDVSYGDMVEIMRKAFEGASR